METTGDKPTRNGKAQAGWIQTDKVAAKLINAYNYCIYDYNAPTQARKKKQ